MADPNATLTVIQPISNTFSIIMNFVKYLVGGIFGIYVISLIVRIYFGKEFGSRLKRIEKNIEEIKIKLNKISKK